MKVIERSLTDEAAEKRYGNILEIEIDGNSVFSVWDGEPEDANLSRDFADCFYVITLIQRAFDAGKNGETLEILYEKVDEIE